MDLLESSKMDFEGFDPPDHNEGWIVGRQPLHSSENCSTFRCESAEHVAHQFKLKSNAIYWMLHLFPLNIHLVELLIFIVEIPEGSKAINQDNSDFFLE